MNQPITLIAVGTLRLLQDPESPAHVWLEVGDQPPVHMGKDSGNIRIKLELEDLEELISMYIEQLGFDEDDDSEELDEDDDSEEWFDEDDDSEEEDPDDF